MANRVLIVDDDEKLQKLVQEYLNGYGYETMALPDSSGVMDNLGKGMADVVILDIMLPGRDGLDILREIRSRYDIPVIMLTAKGDDADRIVGLELGADDYIPKPFNPRELLARIKAVTRRYTLHGGQKCQNSEMEIDRYQRQLRAILSADVKSYSRLMAEDETWTIKTIKTYRDLISSHIENYSGRVVDSPGDNLLAEFGSVMNAVECAMFIQEDLKEKNALQPQNRKMEYRIGVNLGDVVLEKGRIYGDGVNIAARIENLADPGGVSISGTVFDQIEQRLPLEYEFIGERAMKNIRKPIRVYRIRMGRGKNGDIVK
jgi:DNA-binding response OmpR family regulator